MKNLLFMLFLVALVAGCNQTPQKNVEKLATQHLKDALHDPSSYEPVSFSELDTTFYLYEDEIKSVEAEKDRILEGFSETIRIRNLYHYHTTGQEQIFDVLTNNMNINKVKRIQSMKEVDIAPYIKTVDSLALITDKMDLQIDSFKKLLPQLMGFKLYHKYRAKNKMGAKVLGEATFFISSDFQTISICD